MFVIAFYLEKKYTFAKDFIQREYIQLIKNVKIH